MIAKLPAASIAGTIASPSSPSVKFTALDEPIITRTLSAMKKLPKGISRFLKNGTARVLANGSRVRCMTRIAAVVATMISAASLVRAERPLDERLVSFL